MLAAVILAAGASRRMGQPKATLRWRGRSFLTHVVELARQAPCAQIIAVEGACPIGEVPGDVHVTWNRGWKNGPLSSFQRGLATLEGITATQGSLSRFSGILLLTIDRPHVRTSTVFALAEAHESQPERIWQPSHHERRGHPIVLPMDVARAAGALAPTLTLRDLLRQPAVQDRRSTFETQDPAVLQNIDRPEDLTLLPKS